MKSIKTESEAGEDTGLEDAKKFLLWLFENNAIETFHLSPRKQDILKLRWKHHFSVKQIATKFGIHEKRVQQLLNGAIFSVAYRLRDKLSASADVDALKAKIKKLENENAAYKERFALLSNADKENFRSLDKVLMSIEDINFPVVVYNSLYKAGIRTVGDLLQFKKSSLLFLEGISVKNYEIILEFVSKNGLKMKA